MTKPLSSSKAFTLAELLITSLVISIMLAGVVAMDMSVRRMDKEISATSYLYTKTLAMGEDIRQSASRAIGYKNDPGFRDNPGLNYFCFRVAETPESWNCYSYSGVDLYKCTNATPGVCSTSVPMGSFASGDFNAGDKNPCFDDPVFCPGVFKFHVTGRAEPTAGPDDTNLNGTMDNPQVIIQYTVIPESQSF